MSEKYLSVTPNGAYQAVSNTLPAFAKKTLLSLLAYPSTPEIQSLDLLALTGTEKLEVAETILYQLQTMHLIQTLDQEEFVPDATMDELQTSTLMPLSSSGRVLLADSQGLTLGVSNFPLEVVEELSVITADVVDLQGKFANFFDQCLSQKSTAWGLVNSFGDSQLTFLPLYFEEILFMLVLSDTPRLNQQEFRNLVWFLKYRYG